MDAYFGPIFQLELLGLICPCIQKEENRNAVQAVKYLRGRRIQWNRSSSSSGSAFSIGKLFRSPSKLSSSEKQNGLAKIKIRDNEDGHPSLIIDSASILEEPTVVNGSETLDETIPAAPSIQLTVKLGRIDKVILDGNNELVLLAKPVPSNPKPKELLRFIVLDDTNLPARDEVRNICQHHLAVLIEWERQRRYALDDLYDEEDDDENQPNFLQARANKAAHFAKREVEMQKTKREREQRKAKFSSAGLKYTALAMANQQQS